MTHPLAADLDDVLARTEAIWPELLGQRLFITGGTGFFGRWLLESFVWANRKLELHAEATVLTRNPEKFRSAAPALTRANCIRLHEGDIRSFEFPEGRFGLIIHAATPADVELNVSQPLLMLDTIIEGTRRVLDFGVACGASKLLLTSSGAVYGNQGTGVTHTPEECDSAPDPGARSSAYGEGKRVAELLCAIYSRQHRLQTKIARCFAFVGPHMRLDAHFAIGNFIRDALGGGPITVAGDGSPLRSYLYAGDLAAWLWTILVRGEPGRPYNVGSERCYSILQLANTVAETLGGEVVVAHRRAVGTGPERYIPSTERARTGLGLAEWTLLPSAISKTACWAGGRYIESRRLRGTPLG